MDDRSLWLMAGGFPSRLKALSALLDKGAAFVEAQGVAFEALAQAQLAPDMLPLSRQVSIRLPDGVGGGLPVERR